MNRLPSAGALLLCAVFASSIAFAREIPATATAVTETLRIANYNLLNYPGSDAATRNPYFRRGVLTMRPDVLVVQEMTSQAGVNTFLSDVLNKYTAGLYSTIAFHDGPDTDNHIFFKSNKVAFIDASYIATALRDIACYRIRVLATSDTLWLYAVHLKASSGPPNGTLRYNETTILRNQLNGLPPGSQFLVMGDFNTYSSADSGLIPLFRSEADNDGRCKDPINKPGNWGSNSLFAAIHTQSPRVRSFGGGSNGGMDDRFDLILSPANASLDDNILVSTYTPYGNDGNHYNDSINRLPNAAVPDSVANGLHYSSDHLPVFCDFVFSATSGPGAFAQLSPSNGALNQPVAGTLSWQAASAATGYDVYFDTSGTLTTPVSVNIPATSYAYSGLLNSRVYHWKIVARNAIDTTVATGSPWSFTTVVAAPASFALDAPADSAQNLLSSGSLTWHPSAGAASYDVYLDQNNPPTTLVAPGVADTVYAFSGLAPGSAYRWKVVAKNAGGTTTASDAPRMFTTLAVPAAVSGLAAVSITTNSLQLNWTDVATDEDGYRVYRSSSPGGPYVQRGSDLPPGTSSFGDTGLAVNTRYYYHVSPFNAAGEGAPGAVSPATLAVPPGVPLLSEVGGTSMRVTLNPSLNPAATEFAIRLHQSGTDLFVQTNGTTGASSAWQAFAQWGGGTGMKVTGLSICSTYTVSARARNLDAVETAASDTVSATLSCSALSASLADGWNLLSVPVTVPDRSKSTLFPASVSPAYAYEGSYIAEDSLRYGTGYWLKYSGSQQVFMDGEARLLDSIALHAGWNLIGSVSQSVPTGAVSTVPPGIAASNFFGYNGSYFIVSAIEPLAAYWIKASAAGMLILDASAPAAPSTPRPAVGTEDQAICRITVRDAAGHFQYLRVDVPGSGAGSELPPQPVEGAFDARFGGNRSAVALPANASSAIFPLHVQAFKWPVTVEWEGTRGYHVAIAGAGHDPAASGSVEISAPDRKLALRIEQTAEIPQSVTFYQNYPNPFNPSTDIRFALPADAHVKLAVYNMLGELVELLVDGTEARGERSVTWRPAGSSGTYILRLQAAALDGSFSVTETRLLNYLK